MAIATLTSSAAQAAAEPAPATTAAPPTFSAADYHLGSADKVKVTVFNEATLSGEYSVNSDGTIAFPLVGNIEAGGKTPLELQAIIQQRLADGYLRNPSVAVEVESFRPFYIYGEVTHPGEYPYSSGLTVLKAVALAQGFTYRADKKKIFLKRANQQDTTEVRVGQDVPILPGDAIRIAERYF